MAIGSRERKEGVDRGAVETEEQHIGLPVKKAEEQQMDPPEEEADYMGASSEPRIRRPEVASSGVPDHKAR